jgi:hypothetical protein
MNQKGAFPVMKWTQRLAPTFAVLWLAAAMTAAAPPAAKAGNEKQPPTPAPAAAEEDELPLEAPAPPPAERTGPQPPDGKWLTDEQGRKYFLETITKAGTPFLRLDDKTVRTRWGITVDVAKEDDTYIYYKVYRVEGVASGASLPPKPGAEEIARIAASYATDTAESRRLSFAPFSKGLPETGQWRNGFDIADMNGDGHPDIVHGPARKSLSYPAIFLGDGKGSWRRWREAKFPRLPFDYGDAAAADFNGDGHLDLALGMHLRGLVALLGDGKGGFTDWGKGLDLHVPRPGDDGPGFSSRAIAALDWNQDGRPDILAVGEGPRLNLAARDQVRPTMETQSYGAVIYLNQGDGSWVRKDQGTGNGEIFGDAVAVGDFNGDKRRDFATGSSIMGRRSLANYARDDGAWSTTDVAGVRPGSYVRAVTAGDFDGDGRDDLVVGYMSFEAAAWRTGIDVFFARDGEEWARRTLAAVDGKVEVSALDHGDLDADGKLDLVALTGSGETWVFLGDGKGAFTREAATGIVPVEGRCRGYHVELADLDGDGRDEIVSGFAGENSPMFDPDRCLSGGALQVWRAADSRQGG